MKLLEGDLPELALLRSQLHSTRVRHREWTGVGFWTEFDVEGPVVHLPIRERLQITGVYGKHPMLQAGIGFALELENGLLRSLEGYTYEEPWPDNLEAIQVEQEPIGEQRLAELRKLFSGPK